MPVGNLRFQCGRVVDASRYCSTAAPAALPPVSGPALHLDSSTTRSDFTRGLRFADGPFAAGSSLRVKRALLLQRGVR